jgi:hypothetical protein
MNFSVRCVKGDVPSIPQSSSSSGGNGINSYCDYGPVTQYGGGCFKMENANDCDTQWGWVVNTCGLYCDWVPTTPNGGGCYPISFVADCFLSKFRIKKERASSRGS